MIAEAPVQIPPVYTHAHRWQLLIYENRFAGFSGDATVRILARCKVCCAVLEREEIEARLNAGGWMINESENG